MISQVLPRMPCAWTAFLISRLPEAEVVCVGDELRLSGPAEELSSPEQGFRQAVVTDKIPFVKREHRTFLKLQSQTLVIFCMNRLQIRGRKFLKLQSQTQVIFCTNRLQIRGRKKKKRWGGGERKN